MWHGLLLDSSSIQAWAITVEKDIRCVRKRSGITIKMTYRVLWVKEPQTQHWAQPALIGLKMVGFTCWIMVDSGMMFMAMVWFEWVLLYSHHVVHTHIAYILLAFFTPTKLFIRICANKRTCSVWTIIICLCVFLCDCPSFCYTYDANTTHSNILDSLLMYETVSR